MLVITGQEQYHHLGNSQMSGYGHNKKMLYPNRIRELSEKRNWKQADLARATGYEPPVIGRFWHGKRKLHQDHLEVFSKAFKCQPEEIIASINKQSFDNELNYTEVALVYAIKSIINAMLSSKGTDKASILRESFKDALLHYRAANKPAAVSVMDALLEFVGDPQHQEEQLTIRKLLQLSPVEHRKN